MTLSIAAAPSTVMPTMRYRDAPAAIEFLCRVIGFAKHLVVPAEAGAIAHAQLTLGGGMLMLGSAGNGSAGNGSEYGEHIRQPDEIGGFETQSAYVVVADPDAVHARAVAEGWRIAIAIKDEDYGGRGFSCIDPEGRLWNIGSYDPWAEARAIRAATGALAAPATAAAAAAAAARVRRVDRLGDADARGLASLLIDCVEGGASVGFMQPLPLAKALAFWHGVGEGAARGERALLVAEDASGIVGAVQLVLAQPENQPHRADVSKMLVRRTLRRQGLGEALMRAAEQAARDCGKSLLVLDTASADAERLYARLGWQRCGSVPGFALLPGGGLCATTFFYRELARLIAAALAFAAALTCAAAMGFAIQRGGTCTVAAVEELVTRRRATQLAALAEAAVWVGGGLVAASALRMLPAVPAGFEPGFATIAGGVLLGLGAWVNGACILGAVARFGSGQWAYIVTPLGFFLGCLTFAPLFAATAPVPQEATPWVQHAAPWLLVPFAVFACWRLARATRRHASAKGRRWSAHTATTVIGLAFLALLLLQGAWAYTDVLLEAARGMAHGVGARAALSAALLAGAVLGGWTAGLLRHTRASPRQIGRCLAGGLFMGWGALLVPGGNDGLVLVGVPLLRPYAWLALLAMVATIAFLLVVRLEARRRR